MNPPRARVRVPRALVAECLTYERCLGTDEPAVDKVSLAWPTSGLLRRLGPSAVALRRLRLAVGLWMALAIGALLLTGSLALAAVPFGAYVAYRRYVLWRYWIRCRAHGRGDLDLRDVSEGFRAHVDEIVQAAG